MTYLSQKDYILFRIARISDVTRFPHFFSAIFLNLGFCILFVCGLGVFDCRRRFILILTFEMLCRWTSNLVQGRERVFQRMQACIRCADEISSSSTILYCRGWSWCRCRCARCKSLQLQLLSPAGSCLGCVSVSEVEEQSVNAGQSVMSRTTSVRAQVCGRSAAYFPLTKTKTKQTSVTDNKYHVCIKMHHSSDNSSIDTTQPKR